MEAASWEGLGNAALGVPGVSDWLRQLCKRKGKEIASGVPSLNLTVLCPPQLLPFSRTPFPELLA